MSHIGETSYLFGMHDRGAEGIMAAAGRNGWVLVSETIGRDADNTTGGDYQGLADQGFGVMVQLDHGSGTAGTLPLSEFYDSFATRCGNFVRKSSGCHTWIIGHEPNAREQRPECGTPQEETITPQLYARCYKKCRDAIRNQPGHTEDRVVIAAVAPFNSQTSYPGNKRGDWVRYQQDVLLLVGPGNYDGIAIHACTHGNTPDTISHDLKMESPFTDRYYDFKTYQDVMAIVPPKLPAFITRAYPLPATQGPAQGWPNGNTPSAWIQAAYREVFRWNQIHPDRQIRSLIMYHWGAEPAPSSGSTGERDQALLSIQNCPAVIEDFRRALVNDYRWSEPVRPDYRATFLSQNTPACVMAGDTLSVSFRLRNDGAMTWVYGGSNPFRLGSHWYDANGREVLVAIGYHNDLPGDVAPGSEVQLVAKTMTPDTPGRYRLRWEMVHEGVTWFTHQGDQAQTLMIEVLPARLPRKPPIEDVIGQLPHHPAQHYLTRERNTISAVIVHHSAVPANLDARQIARYHVESNHWPGIGYHFFIGPDGHIQQTEPLDAISYHAGDVGNRLGVGVCLAGNFTDQPPPKAQLTATAQLLAWLLDQLSLPIEAIHGHCDYRPTQCPGLTWPFGWRNTLLDGIQGILAQAALAQPDSKVIEHYLLFWQTPTQWARDEWLSAEGYVGRFRVSMGFSVDDARHAQYVTIVGGTAGVPAEVEDQLRSAGCQVERIPGATPAEIKAVLDQLAAQGQPFLTLK
jgi:hypothetical protein